MSHALLPQVDICALWLDTSKTEMTASFTVFVDSETRSRQSSMITLSCEFCKRIGLIKCDSSVAESPVAEIKASVDFIKEATRRSSLGDGHQSLSSRCPNHVFEATRKKE